MQFISCMPVISWFDLIWSDLILIRFELIAFNLKTHWHMDRHTDIRTCWAAKNLCFTFNCQLSVWDFNMIYFSPADMMFAYLLCHLIGVTSTVTNPILYAMLNCNFQKEFQIAAGKIRGLILRKWYGEDVLVYENGHEKIKWNAKRGIAGIKLWLAKGSLKKVWKMCVPPTKFHTF